MILLDQLGVDQDSVTPESSFVNDPNPDSLDIAEIRMEIEQHFWVPISDFRQIVTVGDAVRYIISMQQ